MIVQKKKIWGRLSHLCDSAAGFWGLKNPNLSQICNNPLSHLCDSQNEVQHFNLLKKNTKEEPLMQKMICIPAERYYKMLEAYDQAVEELEQLKKALKELADSSKAKTE